MDEDEYLEDSLEEVSFVPKKLPKRKPSTSSMNGFKSHSSIHNESKQVYPTHYSIEDEPDTDFLEDSITAARRQRASNSSIASLIHSNKKSIAKNFHIMLAGQDEAVLIQRVFRGYRGRMLAAKKQLLQERDRIRSRDMQRKKHVNHSQTKPSRKPSYMDHQSNHSESSSVLIQRAQRLSIDNGSMNKQNPQHYSPLPAYRIEDPTIYNPTAKIPSPRTAQEPNIFRSKVIQPTIRPEEADEDDDELNDSLEKPSQQVKYNNHSVASEPKFISLPAKISVENSVVTTSKPPAPSSSSNQPRAPPSIRDLIPSSLPKPTYPKKQVQPAFVNHVQPSPIRPREQESISIHPASDSQRNQSPQQARPRQRIIQAQAKRAQAAALLQRMYRGYAARKIAKKRREQLYQVDRYQCPNCHRIEQSGSYCKGCGRPRNPIKASKSKANRPMLTTVIEEPAQQARPKDIRERITPTHNQSAKPKEVIRAQPQPVQQQIKPSPMESTIDIQTEERRLLLELAAIDRLQQQKLQDLQQALRHVPPSQTSNSKVTNSKQQASSRQPPVNVAQPKETESMKAHAPSNKSTAKIEEPSIKKEKVAFTSAAKDYKPRKQELQPSISSQATPAVRAPQASQQPALQVQAPVSAAESYAKSIASVSIASKPKVAYLDQQSAYDNPGYLVEYHKKSRASSAGRNRKIGAVEKQYDSRSDGQVPMNRPSYGGRSDHDDHSTVYETVSLPPIQSNGHGLHVSKSAPPRVGIQAQVASKNKIQGEIKFPAINTNLQPSQLKSK